MVAERVRLTPNRVVGGLVRVRRCGWSWGLCELMLVAEEHGDGDEGKTYIETRGRRSR